MCDPVSASLVAATALTAAGSVTQGVAARQQGKYQAEVAAINAASTNQARRQQIDQGVLDQVRADRKNAQLQGAQRVALAGAGVDTSYGTAADIAGDSALIGSEDRQSIATNTMRTADKYAIQSMNYTTEGAAAKARGSSAFASSLFSAGGTILGGAAQVGKYRAGLKTGSSDF